MKQANNNEVDLLLRSLAKGRAESPLAIGSASGGGNGALSDHLDADELNSYAEGVVPAPARARYTEHLADCASCRRIVVGLTQASGAAIRYEAPDQEGGLTFWQKLAALFSLPILRYAVPALVLTAVIGISLLALRQPQRPELVARNQAADPRPASAQPPQTESTNPSTGEKPATISKGSESPAVFDSNEAKNNLKDEKSRLDQAPGTSGGDYGTTAPVVKDGTKAGESGGVADLRPYAPEPKEAAPPAPPAKFSEADKPTELAKEQPAKREDQERSRYEVLRNQPADEHEPNRSRSNTALPAAGQRNAGLMAERGASAQNKKKTTDVETRTVSGRRFAREGNTWVDTNYDSSRATTNLARGSEQFRALVADEPAIRTIADQLSGVVIVVWKNRAYRIQ